MTTADLLRQQIEAAVTRAEQATTAEQAFTAMREAEGTVMGLERALHQSGMTTNDVVTATLPQWERVDSARAAYLRLGRDGR